MEKKLLSQSSVASQTTVALLALAPIELTAMLLRRIVRIVKNPWKLKSFKSTLRVVAFLSYRRERQWLLPWE